MQCQNFVSKIILSIILAQNIRAKHFQIFTKKTAVVGHNRVANNAVLSTYLGKINFMFSNGTTFNNSM